MRRPTSGATTNIGASVPPITTGVTPEVGSPLGQAGGAVALQQAKIVQPEPLWISRWQPSPDPADKWVKAYRWWSGAAAYEDSTGSLVGPPPGLDWIDIWHTNEYAHRHKVPSSDGLIGKLSTLTTSVGRWVHKYLLNSRRRNKYDGSAISP